MKRINTLLALLLGLAALLLAAVTANAQDVVTYFHTDAVGSPIAATDANGNLLWREDYSPYGERLRQENSPRANRLWFTGHHADDDTGLTYAGARYYDPTVGRFLSADPIGANPEDQFSFVRYVYGNNNPYRYVDPNGEFELVAVPLAIGVVVVGVGCHVAGSCEKFGQAVWRFGSTLNINAWGRLFVASRVLSGAYESNSKKPTSTVASPDKAGIAATPPDPDDEDGSSREDLIYQSIRKHEKGGWGTYMDLDSSTAQRVLNNSIQSGRQRYALQEGKLYEFKDDNAGTWHGYPISGDKAPNAVLREFLKRGELNKAQYNKLVRGK